MPRYEKVRRGRKRSRSEPCQKAPLLLSRRRRRGGKEDAMIPFPSSFLFRETSSSVVEGESPIRARAAGEAATLGIQGGGERSMGERGGGGREGKNSVLHFLARFSIAHPTTTTTIYSPLLFSYGQGKKERVLGWVVLFGTLGGEW